MGTLGIICVVGASMPAAPRAPYELLDNCFRDNWTSERRLALFCLQHDIPFEKS